MKLKYRKIINKAIVIGCLVFFIILFSLIKTNQNVSEFFFARGIARGYAFVVGNIASWFPFSLFDVFVICGIVAAVVGIVFIIRYLVKKRGWKALDLTCRLAIAALSVALLYTIVASGIHATTLHYPKPLGQLKQGDLVLLDLGARHGYYNADVSRTLPVDGKFTEEQKELYQIVLGCNKAVAAFAKPGVTIAELNSLTNEYLASECLARGLIEKKEDIRNYFFHGVSHFIGLDTHDPGDRAIPLEPGNIISNEPGLYIKEKGIGIRIEDDLLITEDGCEVLTSSIIKEVEEIEAFYRNR